MGSTSVNYVTITQLGTISSVCKWNFSAEVRCMELMNSRADRSRVRRLCVAGNYQEESGKKVTTLSDFEEPHIPDKLEPLWDDGYGSQSVKDYIEIAKDMIRSDDDDGPWWFCPTECGAPIKDSPLLLYLPGLDGLGLGLILHHKALGKVFEVRCMHIPVKDRTPFKGLVSFVEDAVRLEHASSSKKKPIYLIGDSLGACIALSIAARNPTIDLVLVLVNPATSYSRSKLQYLLPVLEASPDELHIFMPYLYVLNSGNPFKMAAANTTGMSPIEKMKQVFSKLIESLPQLSLSDIIPKDTLLWKLMLLKSAAAYANSRLHAVTAQVLVLASGKDNMFPSRDEADRIEASLKNCNVRYFRDNGHSILLEDGVNLLTIIKGTLIYRRESRRYDYATDFIPPSKSEFKQLLDQNRIYRCLTSSAMFSTLGDGKIVRGLSGIPSEGPVILVGYHMLTGLELLPIVDEFLRRRNIIVRGIAHPILFSKIADWLLEEFIMKDCAKLFGAAPVSAANLFKLFKTKSHVLMYPGGAREALHRKGEAYKLFWPEQPEFVRMAAKFGATIVPFGVVGEDDLVEIVFDNNDLLKIPVLDDHIRKSKEQSRARVNVTRELTSQDMFICILPKIPGRLYYLFGKPIQTKGKEEMLQDRNKARELYLDIKSEVENSIDYLLIKREEDPYRRLFDRTVYRAFSAHTDHVPAFDP